MRRLAIMGVVAATTTASTMLGWMGSAAAEAERYVFDTAHTNVLFFVSHLGFSRMQGEFRTFDGGFTFDSENVGGSSTEVTIDTASVDTDHEGLDKHLRSADFFNVDKFPTMTFVSSGIERTGDNTGQITGTLTMLGVAKPVTLDVTFNKAGVHPINGSYVAGFSARGSIKRSDFGMTYGVPAIGDDVEIVLEVEGVRQ